MARVGYKLFRYKSGSLYPLFVFANRPVPIGEWLSAEDGPRTEDGKVKSRLGELAYRPGWHINDGAPYVNHIYSNHDGKRYLKDGCVWCEVEYNTDVCYSDEAYDNGWKNGKWAALRAQLDHIPVDGYYTYKTSPQMFGTWIISGEMKVDRIMSDDEVESLCKAKGLTPLERWGNA